MNRHKRRKAAKFELKTVTHEELFNMGRICGWRGCRLTLLTEPKIEICVE
jgi:hypothetical protein